MSDAAPQAKMPQVVRSHRAMDTAFTITIQSADAALATSAAEAAFARIDAIEGLLSRFNDTSDVALIAALRPGEVGVVALETMCALTASARVCEATGGAFDPTLAEALIAQGVFTREQYASVNGTSGEQADVFDPERVYEKLMAMREVLPDGMIWTGEEHWALEYEDVINGVVTQITFNGYGCAAFALRLTSAAFGKLPLRTLGRGTFRYEDLRVGDTLRIENDTHSAVILELYDDHVVVAEGAYNNSVHWGRSLSREEAVSANYVWTRYPA